MPPIKSEDYFTLPRIADIVFSVQHTHGHKFLTHLAVGTWSPAIPIVLTSALSLFSISLQHRFYPSLEISGWKNYMSSTTGPVFLSLKIRPGEPTASRLTASMPHCNNNPAGFILLNGQRTWETGFGFPFEILELLDTLNGRGPGTLTKLILEIGSEMLCLSGAASSRREARFILREEMLSGHIADAFLKTTGEAGLTTFKSVHEALGSGRKVLLRNPSEGYLFNPSRERLNLLLDMEARRGHRIGLRLLKETGDLIETNSAVAEMLICHPVKALIQKNEFLKVFMTKKDPPAYLPLVLDRFGPP